MPLVSLEREWKSLVQGRLADELRRWRAREPALARFESPQRVLAFLWDKKASPSEKDRVLLALLRLAQSESLAERVVLQAMMPALKALARGFLRRHPDSETEPALEREELWQVLFTAMLQQIKSYPLEARPAEDRRQPALGHLPRSDGRVRSGADSTGEGTVGGRAAGAVRRGGVGPSSRGRRGASLPRGRSRGAQRGGGEARRTIA